MRTCVCHRSLPLLLLTHFKQIISLSDVFISPLEDLYLQLPLLTISSDTLVPDILSLSCLERIFIASLHRGHSKNNSSNTSSTKFWCVSISTFIPFTSPNLRPAWTQIRTFCWCRPPRLGETHLTHSLLLLTYPASRNQATSSSMRTVISRSERSGRNL
jgi:hypothetical protein